MPTSRNRSAGADSDQILLPLVLADDLTDGLVVIDPKSVIRYANPAMTRIFGYGRDELVGEPLTTLMPEEYREPHREALGRYLDTGERNLPWSEVELPGLHRDGHRVDLRISFSEFTWRGDRLFAGSIRNRTAAKEPEEEQRILARSYRALFEENVAAVFRTSPDGRMLAANDALARMAGYEDPEELRGRDVTAFYAEGENREEFLRDLREHREVRNRELRLRRADGTTRWCLVNAVWVDDADDPEPAALVGTVVDISDRKRAEREVRLSEERYRRLFEQDLVGVFRSEPEPDGEILSCNEAIADMFGYADSDEMVGLPARRFYPEGQEEREQTLAELRERGSFLRYEVELERRDGSPIWVLAHSRLLVEPSGQELIEGIFLDITERKAARRALEQAKEKFETVFSVSPVAIGIADLEGNRFVETNPAFEDLFGYGADELTEGEVSPQEVWAERDERDAVARQLRDGKTVRNREVRFRRKDGSVWDALFSATLANVAGEEYMVGAAQDISHLKEVERELEHQSLHDRLTGLPNRALFWDRLEHALERSRRTGERTAVLFLDLDGFKRVNDEHGHATGDEVLRRVAGRLRSAVRGADTVARLGGDEFGVLLEDLEEESDAVRAARRLTDRFEPAVPVAGEEALIHVSCGIALAGSQAEEETVTPDDLVQRADRAMYVAKEVPGSSSHLYSPDEAGERTGRLRREVELKEALEAGEVVPYYQPIVDLEDGRIVGAEALARWEHPERGLVLPGEFIPLAEETGLIVELGPIVTRSACVQLADWRERGIVPEAFRLHVNLSARELDHTEVVESLEDLFREVGLDPERVAFEVTESVAMKSSLVLRRIRELGPTVAIDDFGTEYATLKRLAETDLDSLKIDRSFVGGIGESGRHEAVLEASLTLANSMDLCAVAEGVETERQRAGLLERGCQFGQGFLFARAVPAAELEDWLEERQSLPAE